MDNHFNGGHQNQEGAKKDLKSHNGTETSEKIESGSSLAEADGNGQQSNDGQKDVVINTMDISPKTFLELLPSKQGTLLAAILVNIMTEGLTPVQENILGNFVSAVGSLISYKASRDELNETK